MPYRSAFYISLVTSVVRATPLLATLVHHDGKHKDIPEKWSAEFYWHIGISLILVLAGGVFAGLTLGLMGLDELHLRVLASSSDIPQQRRDAATVLRLLSRGRHWVLVVLLLGNVIVNESLPIFLDNAIGGGVAAVVISTTMIVIFGEIIPQAVCARFGLQIGARCAPLVLGMMYIFAPVAWPIAQILDYVLGEVEGHSYKKAELKSFLQFHRESAEPLRDDEITILNGVLSLNEKKLGEIMTPMKDVVTLSADVILDDHQVDQLLLSGYSRFPVHMPNNPTHFIGILLIKRLIAYDADMKLPVNAIPLSILPEAKPSINCFQALDYFQTGRAHLLLVSEHPGEPYGALGVVTLEDVIEEIIEEEIVDETDRYESNQTKRRARRISTASVMKGIVEREKSGRLSNGTSLLSAGVQSRLPTPHITPSNSAAQDDLRHALITSATESSALLRGSPIRESGEYGRDQCTDFDGMSSSPGTTTTVAAGGATENGGADRLSPSKLSNYGGTSLLHRD